MLLFHISKLLRKLVSRMPIIASQSYIASLTESLLTFGTFYFMHMIWNNGFRLGWPFTEKSGRQLLPTNYYLKVLTRGEISGL